MLLRRTSLFTAFFLSLVLAWTPAAEAQNGARSRAPSSRRVIQTDGYRTVVKTKRKKLPASRRIEHGKLVRVQEKKNLKGELSRFVQTFITDGEVDSEGNFIRTTKTSTFEAKAGKALPSKVARLASNTRHGVGLYSNKKLGAFAHKGKMQVRVFAPTAQQVVLVMEDGTRVNMETDSVGVWGTSLPSPAKLWGKKYYFEVDGKHVADPYEQSYDRVSSKSIFTDESFDWTDQGFKAPDFEDLIISEIHVGDETLSPTSPVPADERGTYLALANPNVLRHRKEMGSNAIELLPIHKFDPTKNGPNHWGYMTEAFNAPSSRYAKQKNNAPRELKKAINEVHNAGQAVIADVVYNHTDNGEVVSFMLLGQQFYYRLSEGRYHMNGSGTGNEFATEKPMARKVVLDTLRHWVEDYHIDGFRFDLGALIDQQTIHAINRALPKRIYKIYEPWAADGNRVRWGKGARLGGKGDKFALWNDDYRHNVGDFAKGTGDRERAIASVSGSQYPNGFALKPSETINMLTSHDEQTWADQVGGDKTRNILGATLLYTSQGIPMLDHGQEMMRTKKGVKDAYNQDNDISHIDWSHAKKHADVLAMYSGLAKLRANYPNFRYRQPLTGDDVEWLRPANDKAFGYLLKPPRTARGRKNIPDFLVLTNSHGSEWATFDLPRQGDWKIISDGAQINLEGLRTASGNYAVPPGTAVILSQPRP